MSQEKGRAGRNSSAMPDKYSYELVLYFSLESFLFLFQQIMTPVEGIRTDIQYQKQQLKNLIDAAKLLTSHSSCFSMEFERILGNPQKQNDVLGKCNNCQNCKPGNKRMFPPIVKDNVIAMMLDLFVVGDVAMQLVLLDIVTYLLHL